MYSIQVYDYSIYTCTCMSCVILLNNLYQAWHCHIHTNLGGKIMLLVAKLYLRRGWSLSKLLWQRFVDLNFTFNTVYLYLTTKASMLLRGAPTSLFRVKYSNFPTVFKYFLLQCFEVLSFQRYNNLAFKVASSDNFT